MSARIAFVAAALLVVSAAAHSQPQPKPAPQPPSSGGLIPPPSVPLPSVPTTPPPPPEKSVEDLLNELERVQAQKAALEKQEAELKATLRKKLDAQAERLKKLGVAAQPDKVEGSDRIGAATPDHIGRITIEGNTKTRDDKILALVDLQTGQILRDSAIGAARLRLEKAGFRDVVIEIVPNDIELPRFKDIRVKVTESDKR